VRRRHRVAHGTEQIRAEGIEIDLVAQPTLTAGRRRGD